MKNNDNDFPDWKPMQDLGIIFDDKTAEDRSPETLNKMFNELRDIVNNYGFDVNRWNSGYLTGFTSIENDDEEN